MIKMAWTFCVVLWLAGCATVPPPGNAQLPWKDAEFAYDPARVEVTRDDLFRLDAQLQARLRDPAMQGATRNYRLRQLLSVVFGATDPGERQFGYEAGHSTPAAETWQRRKGDCISLAMLTYAVARALEIPAQMQEVQTPAIFDRRGQLDFVNQHVNVLFPKAHRELFEIASGQDVVVDFEPEFATGRRGTTLDEDGILARFYNNLAVEAMARGERERAYAHFRAAIFVQPGYAAPYANLAVLYRSKGFDEAAETLLRRALAAQPESDVALYGLHRLLEDTKRFTEARQLARVIEDRQAADPYYWMGRGLRSLEDGDARRAVAAFEKARAIASGFSELHRYLAIAYARAGQQDKAKEQLVLLAEAGVGPGKLGLLKRKMGMPVTQ